MRALSLSAARRAGASANVTIKDIEPTLKILVKRLIASFVVYTGWLLMATVFHCRFFFLPIMEFASLFGRTSLINSLIEIIGVEDKSKTIIFRYRLIIRDIDLLDQCWNKRQSKKLYLICIHIRIIYWKRCSITSIGQSYSVGWMFR